MPDIAIWNQCNNHCIMCTNPESFQAAEESIPYSFESIKQRWTNRVMGDEDALSLTGGEPTIHPDFFRIVRWFRAQYPNRAIVVVSNGRMFSYARFAQDLLKIRNLVLEVAIHGYDEKSHDSVTRTPGSFRQTVQGIHRILARKDASQELELRIVVTKLTYRHLGKILRFIRNEFDTKKIRDVAVIFMEMEGQARDNARIVGISYAKVAKYVAAAVRAHAPFFDDFRLFHFPLCVLPHGLWQYAWRTLRGEEVLFLPSCRACSVKKYCLGIHKDYLAEVGRKEFKPVRNVRVRAGHSFHKPIDTVLQK